MTSMKLFPDKFCFVHAGGVEPENRTNLQVEPDAMDNAAVVPDLLDDELQGPDIVIFYYTMKKKLSSYQANSSSLPLYPNFYSNAFPKIIKKCTLEDEDGGRWPCRLRWMTYERTPMLFFRTSTVEDQIWDGMSRRRNSFLLLVGGIFCI